MEIGPSLIFHRPKDADTASSLALLQEEKMDTGERKNHTRPDAWEVSKRSKFILDKFKHGGRMEETSKSERLMLYLWRKVE